VDDLQELREQQLYIKFVISLVIFFSFFSCFIRWFICSVCRLCCHLLASETRTVRHTTYFTVDFNETMPHTYKYNNEIGSCLRRREYCQRVLATTLHAVSLDARRLHRLFSTRYDSDVYDNHVRSYVYSRLNNNNNTENVKRLLGSGACDVCAHAWPCARHYAIGKRLSTSVLLSTSFDAGQGLSNIIIIFIFVCQNLDHRFVFYCAQLTKPDRSTLTRRDLRHVMTLFHYIHLSHYILNLSCDPFSCR
jgi:hypothetical protein